jgi:hypothetical protein
MPRFRIAFERWFSTVFSADDAVVVCDQLEGPVIAVWQYALIPQTAIQEASPK